ncbi:MULTISPECIES: hypothetical protein [Nocardioides]|uniref:DUF5709 domain-containing protein n=1 Tax=Nocardioides vastitatis TaxID=2568655 RepID=A0ABW0ZLB5_9ACTN|nr:hypothetical protein [Nocardioides sp.]THI96486.1 hypothetical protein E7Z54_16790 [Nocardioides sp.]
MTPHGEPFDETREANEADLAEQAQELDGGGSVDEYAQDADRANPDDLEQAQPLHGGEPREETILSSDTASEGDVLEQRAVVDDDDEDYPRDGG